MAAYRSSTSTNTGAAASASIVVSVPAGIQVHDVLIAAIGHDGGTASTISTPAGWTLLRNTSSTGANLRLAVFWRLADGSESANYTWTFDIARQASATMAAYSGAAPTPPPSNSSSSTTVAGTAQSGTGTNSSYESGFGLQFFALRNTTGSVTQTANASYTKREDTCTTASVFVGLDAQDNVKPLPVTSTSATGNTATIASTGVCIAVFLEDARPAYFPLLADQYFVGSIATSAPNVVANIVQTNVPNVTLLAWITINKEAATVSSIAATGLTWTLVSRANAATGSVELWRAFSAAPLAATTATITFSASIVSANFMIVGFINADFSGSNGSAAIGAVANATFTTAVPTVSLSTTRNNSWVWAVTQSSTTTTTAVAGSAQTIMRTQTDATNTTQSIMWRQTARTAVTGTSVTMNLTAPSTGTGNVLAVEILPAQMYNLGTLGAGS